MTTIWTPDSEGGMRAVNQRKLGFVLRHMADRHMMFRVLSLDGNVNIGDDRGTVLSLPRKFADRFPVGAAVWAFTNYGEVGLASRTGDGQIRTLMIGKSA